jgi:hypothetical protein
MKMLVMRNSIGGMIWQAYRVENAEEETILIRNANQNGFLVETQPEGYTTETTPGWRDTPEWKVCLAKFRKGGKS